MSVDAVAVKSPIDWDSQRTHWMFNPGWTIGTDLQKKAPELHGHVWIRSSGTTSWNETRWVALSKIAFLESAKFVNKHLQITHKDIWLKCLPNFHVGGLSIFARAHLQSNKIIELNKWSAKTFVELLAQHQCTLSSLVPTQVYDLVQAGLRAPEPLRAVVVGGDALSESVYKAARALRWPLLPSYGMTECCSQVATADLSSLQDQGFPKARLLGHIKAQVTQEGVLSVLSPSLLTGELFYNSEGVTWRPHKKGEAFITKDKVKIENDYLIFLGRSGEAVKVLGELVSLQGLRQRLSDLLLQRGLGLSEWHLLNVSDRRKGSDLILVTDKWSPLEAKALAAEFNQSVAPYERVSSIYWVRRIPKTDLGKVQQDLLLSQLRL